MSAGPPAGYPEGMILPRSGPLRFGVAIVVAIVLGLAVGPDAEARSPKKKKDVDPASAAFVENYKSDDAKERAAAVEALKNTPDEKRLALVSKYVVGKEKRADVVARAVTVLSKIKDEKAIASLIAAAGKGKPDQRVVYLRNGVLPQEHFGGYVSADIARARPHVPVGKFEPSACERILKFGGILEEAL